MKMNELGKSLQDKLKDSVWFRLKNAFNTARTTEDDLWFGLQDSIWIEIYDRFNNHQMNNALRDEDE